MSEFWIFFEKGLRHILDLSAYDHILFLIALTIPYAFKDWKRLLLLVTIFTIGHTAALLLSVSGVMIIKINLVTFLIPTTILIIAFFNLFTAGKSSKQESISVIGFVTLFFGMIHGLSFAAYFKTVVNDSPQSQVLSLSEFSLGIETSQIIVVFIVLILSYIVQTFFRFSKRDWTLAMSSFVIGVVLPMIISSEIWNR
ncbi:HupE/UreJ family protein [Flavobacterium sp.]|uniref:HupE/UreJ family protein n=1 Tax=Flavobacterium sp. TaxID=239 RepID=UPI00286E2A61|nr:HupE/UreJ family protein [Flavobacterium sp.]